MITKMFSVYDGKGMMFGTPFCFPQLGMAVRAFSDLVNDPQSMLHRHAGDYSLYQIGTFDDSDGKMVSLVPQVLLGHGSDFKMSANYGAPGRSGGELPAAEGSTEEVSK